MSADTTAGADGELEDVGWSCPPGEGEVSTDGERYRITWHPSSDETKIALFRVATDDRRCVLQHIREIRIQQRGESYCEIREDVQLDEVPDKFLEEMRRDGFEPANEVNTIA